MKYMGSKRRIAKHILPIMLVEAEKQGIKNWIEPFVGGGNMIDKVPSSFKRIGYDVNDHTIHAMIGIRDHLDKFPSHVSEEYYRSLKGNKPDYVESWVRYEMSFASKLDNGYARNSIGTDYAKCAFNLAEKQSPLIQDVDFICSDFAVLDFENCLIYCDPPYKGTSKYKIYPFNYELFYDWCREQAKKNIVFVSEYSMPDGFIQVWQGEIKTNFASNRKTATHNAVERLFICPTP